ADEALSESQVRQVMEYYLAVRMRRLGSSFGSSDNGAYGRSESGRPNGPHLPSTVGPNGVRPNGVGTNGMGPNGVRGPVVPRPSLVSNGRVATAAEPRATAAPRLRTVRSQDDI
ncbi:MAG: hypothetical protein ABUL57_02220, partial [Chloroflexota bacterium]